MKIFITIFIVLFVTKANAQSFVLQDQATITLGSDASFFMGGDASLNGTFINNGTIISYSNLDVGDNTTMQSIVFVGADDQTLSANDTLRVNNLSMDKESESQLNLGVELVIVEETLAIVSGVLGAGADTTLLASGEITGGSDDGFIEGKLVSLTQSDKVSFPLGVNGFYNAITLSNLPENVIIVVESSVPDSDRLKPTEDMIGISSEVEWIITTPGDSIEVSASAIFSGIDLSFDGLSNGQFINAQDYTPVLVKYSASDTLYQDLGAINLRDTDMETFGSIDSEKTFYISNTPTYVGIARIPLLVDPVFFVPNAFSPNSNVDENRVFRPYFAGAEVTSITINIIDSNQNNIYSYSDSADNIDLSLLGWDGTLPNGQFADHGVYYYKVLLEAGGQTYSDFDSFLLTN
ncbi:MAG: hypothetical protein OCD76_21405 [Reichenbachiella sp.]